MREGSKYGTRAAITVKHGKLFLCILAIILAPIDNFAIRIIRNFQPYVR